MDWIIKNIFSILNLIILVLLSLYGKAWVNRKKSNLEKEIEGLKSSHSKEQFIHKLQFEKEFKTYSYLWMRVAHFERAVKNFYDNPSKPKDWDTLMSQFNKELHEVTETRLNNIPFISEEVVIKVKQLIDLSLEPAMDKSGRITKICGEIEKAIRERIDNMGGAKLIE